MAYLVLMQINVTSNASTVAKALDAFGKNQMPFAMSQSLNDAAFAVRKDTIERGWPSDITMRNRTFMSAMLMPIRGENRATKRKLKAIVQNHPSGPRHRDYLQRLAVGGQKLPRGNNLAIPGRDMRLRVRGGVTKANRPRNLLGRKNVFRVKLKSGQDAIVRRASKQRYPLQMLYILEPSGFVRKQFDFYDDANQTARRVMAKSFDKRFKAAKRSARR